MTPKSFSPLALTEGRIARGYNKAQLATAIGISRQAVSLIEKGEIEPKQETLSKISKELRLPQKYFYREPINDFVRESPTFFRKLSKATDMSHEKANIKAKWHYSGYLELTKYLKRLQPNLPKFSYDKEYDFTMLNEDSIEEYAKSLRSFWGLGLGPIIGLTPLFEKNGILIFQVDVPTDINGFSFYANGNVPFIICSKKVSAARNRFNLAHEIAHLLLHAVVDEVELEKYHKQIEEQAHLFAGAFLFPKERFIEEFFSTDLNYLIDLKLRWGISISAIIQRAFHLGILSEDELTNFYKRNAGIRKKEPKDNDVKIEQPTFSQNGLKAILDANLITIDDLKSELPYGNDDLSEIFYKEKDFFDPKNDLIGKEATNIIEFKPMV